MENHGISVGFAVAKDKPWVWLTVFGEDKKEVSIALSPNMAELLGNQLLEWSKMVGDMPMPEEPAK